VNSLRKAIGIPLTTRCTTSKAIVMTAPTSSTRPDNDSKAKPAITPIDIDVMMR
jgi:hypothetical protein